MGGRHDSPKALGRSLGYSEDGRCHWGVLSREYHLERWRWGLCGKWIGTVWKES